MKTHLAVFLLFCFSACAARVSGTNQPSANAVDPKKFLDEVNESLLKLNVDRSQARWISKTYITDDTSALNAKSKQRLIEATERYAKDAVKFDKAEIAPDLRRQLNLLKL